MFAKRVQDFLVSCGGSTTVYSVSRGTPYHIQLVAEEVRVDGVGLLPIPLTVFDVVENCLNNGIHYPGNARERLGDSHLDSNSIMYYVGVEAYGKNIGDSIADNKCYIFAILAAAGCIHHTRGRIDF